MQMLGTWLVAFQDIRPDGGRNPIGRRTESDRTADGIRSDGGRNPIGRRTESDRTADGIRSGGGRNPMENVMPSRRCFQGVHPLKKALKNRNKKPPDMW